MKVAVIGRPNTGKSTFINTLAHAERMIVSERRRDDPGLGRRPVRARRPAVRRDRHRRRSAARRRSATASTSTRSTAPSGRSAGPTSSSSSSTRPRAISRLDKQMADYIAKQYKPCIFTVNKWDLMTNNGDPENGMGRFAVMVQHAFRGMGYMPLAFITAKTGRNVKALLNLSQSMFKQSSQRVGTGTLNRVVREAIDAHQPGPRRPEPSDLLRDPGRHGPAHDRPLRQLPLPVRRDLSALPDQRLPRPGCRFKDVPIKLYPPGAVAVRARRGRGQRTGTPRRRIRAATSVRWWTATGGGAEPRAGPSSIARSTTSSPSWRTETEHPRARRSEDVDSPTGSTYDPGPNFRRRRRIPGGQPQCDSIPRRHFLASAALAAVAWPFGPLPDRPGRSGRSAGPGPAISS